MTLTPRMTRTYHVFLASPGDVSAERQAVRRFFDDYNRHTAHIWNARFEVIDWENYSTVGVGHPQELITKQTLERFRNSLALVIGIMAQRFGSPTGKAESGTKEEFEWAMEVHKETGFPEIKWFFRKIDKLDGLSTDPSEAIKALEQWQKVQAFRQRMQDLNDPVFYTEYPGESGFAKVFEHDLNLWLAAPERPWAAERTSRLTAGGAAASALPAEFRSELYRESLLRQFDKLNFEMLDTTGVEYNRVRLWSVFVPQSARESHQYNPRLLEIPKEHQQRLLDAGEITSEELEESERQMERLRQDYFSQPRRPVLDVIDEALRDGSSANSRKLVILGDPGSGKSSLIRFLALRWAQIAEPSVRAAQPVPLVIELGPYGRWACDGQKSFIRYLEESQCWHQWPHGLLDRLIGQPGRVVLLLDGLDEIFDVVTRNEVINDIHRFSGQFPHLFIVVTSRVVGYQPQRLRDAEFRHFMLQDLDADQIAAFIERWHEETFDDDELARPKRERLQKAIRDSKSIAMLAGNPLLLTMMAILNRNQELPRDRADLYNQASRVLLHQWDTERALADFPGISAEISLREKSDLLRRIAAHMQNSPEGLKGNMIDGDTLTGLIEEYLRTELRFDQARAVARALVEQLRQRNFILCFVGANSYAFVHRTFLEYFCAADIVHQFNIVKTLDIDGLIALFDQHCRDDDWREVLRLICGQIDEQFVGKIVEHLATRTDLEKWDGETPLPELPLAIWCLSELRNLAKSADVGDILLERIACFVCSANPRVWFYVIGGMPTGLIGNIGEYFFSELLPAAEELGTRWPLNRTFLEITNYHENSIKPLSKLVWPEFVAAITVDRVTVETFLEKDSYMRCSAIRAISKRWIDNRTRELLTQYLIGDSDLDTRYAAFQALVEKWPDEEMLMLVGSKISLFEKNGGVLEKVKTAIETLREKLGVDG
jgi:GTPase SAR1 family protein